MGSCSETPKGNAKLITLLDNLYDEHNLVFGVCEGYPKGGVVVGHLSRGSTKRCSWAFWSVGTDKTRMPGSGMIGSIDGCRRVVDTPRVLMKCGENHSRNWRPSGILRALRSRN